MPAAMPPVTGEALRSIMPSTAEAAPKQAPMQRQNPPQPLHPEPRPSRASWRHPAASPLALTDIEYVSRSRAAARSRAIRFDLPRRSLALMDAVTRSATTWQTRSTAWPPRRIDELHRLIATASTTCCRPFQPRPQFGSLDHISGGRVGWNIVTSWLAAAAS